METHCLAQPFSCLGYEKAGEPSAMPPPLKAPSSFLPLSLLLLLVILEPTSPYISWDTFISRIQQFRATRFNRESPKPTFYHYLCWIAIFLSESTEMRSFVLQK